MGNRDWCIDEIAKGTMKADRQRLTQAIINLANNAVRHTAANNTIALGSRLNKSNVEFWLRDTGQGIPLNEQKRIFERFARVQAPYNHSEGSGLGLSIVKAIVEAHGGRIDIDSQPGIGTTFTVYLPVSLERKYGAA